MEDVLVKVRNKRLYSPQENEIILKQAELYPTNLHYAFEEASKLLVDRNPKAICVHYYISPKMRKDPKVKAVTCGSKKGFTQNVKNLKRDIDGNMPEQDLKGYMWVMKEMLDLPREERELIVSFLTGIPAGRTKKLFN
jgi:hypothetical protein